MLFNRLGYSPGLLEIHSHSKLISDAVLTLMSKIYENYNLNQKRKIVTKSCFESRVAVYCSGAITATLRMAIAKLQESVILIQRA